MSRKIIHVDMDAYYASVEQLLRPSFLGQPVVVAGSSRRSVVSAASYEARRFGIHSAMPLAKARETCPQLIVLPVRMSIYRAYSIRIMEIFSRYTPAIEPVSLDEAFLDVTDSAQLFGSAAEIVDRIKSSIQKEIHLPCSIGLAPNKFLAKLASEKAKPNGTFILETKDVAGFLRDMPIRDIPGVGHNTAGRLQDLGIYTVGQLRESGPPNMHRRFGSAGDKLWQLAHGIDDSPVITGRQRKSLGHEITFENDLHSIERLLPVLARISGHVGTALRSSGIFCHGVRIKFKYGDFTVVTRQNKLATATDRDEEIFNAARCLLLDNCQPGQGVRLLGITCTHLSSMQQMTIGEDFNRKDGLYKGIDKIRSRYGIASIMSGTTLLDNPDPD